MAELSYKKFGDCIAELKAQYDYLLNTTFGSDVARRSAKNSVIHCFIVTFDTSHKMIRKHLTQHGIADVSPSPKPIFRTATESELIDFDDLENWFDYTKARVDATHDYDESKAGRALDIVGDFIADVERLFERMQAQNGR